MPRLPGIHHRRAIAAFQRAGFRITRQSSHVIMSDGTRTIVIPRHDPINAITMAGIVNRAGLTLDEFRELL